MKKTNVDLIVGGSILLALFILVAGVLWLKEASLSRKMVRYTALFPNVGTLQVGDPVSVNGVGKGSVAKIRLRGAQVAVDIDMEKDVQITDSCKVVVQNIGLMGERGIGITLSLAGKPVSPTDKSDTTFLDGHFDTGIAEAMGKLGSVLDEVQTLATNITTVVESTVGDTSFLNLFQVMVARLDTITDVAQSIVVKNQPLVNTSISNLTTTSTDLKNLLQRNAGRFDTIVNNGQALSAYSLVIASKVDSLASSVHGIVHEVEKGQGSLGMLVKDEQFYHDIKHAVANLDSLVTEVQDDALKLRIRIGLGKGKRKSSK